MYLELLNKKKVKLDTKIKLRTLQIAENLEIISKGFLGRLLSMAIDSSQNSNDAFQNIDDQDLTNAPYLAYLNANLDDAMPYEEFSELLPANFMLFAEVYKSIVENSVDEDSYKLSKNFQNATPHQRNKSKKKYRK